jgi:hypothetical protein
MTPTRPAEIVMSSCPDRPKATDADRTVKDEQPSREARRGRDPPAAAAAPPLAARARDRVVDPLPRDPGKGSGAVNRDAVQLLVTVVYELLDAHDDTTRLAAEDRLDHDPHWANHLAYVRGLQRVAREDIARATATDDLL